MSLQARPVDPTDVSWEVSEPTFRVYLWRRPRPPDMPVDLRPPGVLQSQVGWHCSEWELTGGDVEAALRWTDEHVAGWDAADVWVLVPPGPDGRAMGLIRLRGHNPNEAPKAE